MKRKIAAITIMSAVMLAMTGCAGGAVSNEYIKITKYKGVEVDAVEGIPEITDESVENNIQTVLEGFAEITEVTDRPVVATHSNARSVFPNPRNLTDEQFTAIINTNGVAGLNMYAGFLGDDPDLDTVVAHLEHFLSLGGENNVQKVPAQGAGQGLFQKPQILFHFLLRHHPQGLVQVGDHFFLCVDITSVDPADGTPVRAEPAAQLA